MNKELPAPPSHEKEPAWPSLEEIVTKINSFAPTDSSQCGPAEITRSPDGHVTQVCYTFGLSDGKTALIAYDLGPKYTAIAVGYFRGDPSNGDSISGDTLAYYDRTTGQWTDTKEGANFAL